MVSMVFACFTMDIREAPRSLPFAFSAHTVQEVGA